MHLRYRLHHRPYRRAPCGIESNDTPNQIFLSFQQRTVGQTTPSVTFPLCGSGSEYPRNVVNELLLAIKELAPKMDTGIFLQVIIIITIIIIITTIVIIFIIL